MTDVVAPPVVSDPHRSLIAEVRSIFDKATRAVSGLGSPGNDQEDVVSVAASALAAAAAELAAVLDTRAKDEAAYFARLEAEKKIVAEVDVKVDPSPASVALTGISGDLTKVASDASTAPEP